MQTHSEHFDWLTLRHRVDGVEQAQYRLEKDLMSIPSVDEQDDVVRVNLGNSGPSDADGWATKANLLGASVLFIISLQRYRNRMTGEIEARIAPGNAERLLNGIDRVNFRHVLLFGILVTIILGVRILGIVLDRHLSFLSVHMIAAILYPVLALGIPLSTYLIARGLERRLDAAIAASTSLAVAIWIDYGLLAVEVLPIDVIFQRVLLVIAIGLIAGGAA